MSISSSRSSLCVLALAGCGRIGFDSLAADATRPGDATNAGLVAWWKLDEGTGVTVADSAGANDGTIVGPATWNPAGHFGAALAFPGIQTATVRLGTPAALNNLPALTISAWLEPSSISSAMTSCYFDKGDSGGPIGGWSVFVGRDADGDLGFDAFYAPGDAIHVVTAPGTVAVGQWFHVVTTWDGSQAAANVHIYLDGSEVPHASDSDAVTARPDDSQIDAAIGCNASTGYGGLEDDIKIFDRVLSPAEIARI